MSSLRCGSAVGCRKASDESGISLIEVMIAMFIVSVGVFALASTAITSVQSTRIARERQDATQLASTIIEEARAASYATVALATGEYDPSTSGSTYDGRDIIALGDGAIPHEVSAPPLSATVWVTWNNAAQTEKRVTVTVDWADRGGRQLVQSTLIAEARRGLPVPNFQVEPTLVDQDATEGEVACFDHTLTNLGESDSYSWTLLHEDGSGSLVAATPQTRNVVENGNSVSRQGYAVTSSGVGQGWFAWVRMGPTTTTLAAMVDQTSDQRPDSVDPVPRRDQAVVRVCYTPNDPDGDLQDPLDTAPTFTVRMLSAFDETVVREVQDSLSIIDERQGLYLHHPRKNSGIEVNHGYKLLMDPYEPTYTDASVNYDKANGSAPDARPGLRLTTTASFDYQNTGSDDWAVVADDAKVFLAVGTDSTLDGAGSSPDVNLTYEIRRVAADGSQTVLGTASQTQAMDPSDPWDLAVATIPMTSATIGANEYLRLNVTCTTSSSDYCHIHYDVNGSYREPGLGDAPMTVTRALPRRRGGLHARRAARRHGHREHHRGGGPCGDHVCVARGDLHRRVRQGRRRRPALARQHPQGASRGPSGLRRLDGAVPALVDRPEPGRAAAGRGADQLLRRTAGLDHVPELEPDRQVPPHPLERRRVAQRAVGPSRRP